MSSVGGFTLPQFNSFPGGNGGRMVAAGAAGAAANRGSRKLTGFVSTRFEKRRAKLAAKVGLTVEQLPKRRFRALIGKVAKVATEATATAGATFGTFWALGGRFLRP
jgi:hypothetical protein